MEEKSDSNNILWHYTSTQAAANIITDDEFWVTDYRFLNDESEFFHGLRIFCAEARILKPFEVEYNLKCLHDFFDWKLMAKDSPQEMPTNIPLINAKARARSLYSMSFSTKGDSLTQWMGYLGKNGGCALGFDKNRLMNAFKIAMPPIIPFEETFLQCIYDDEIFKKACRQEINDSIRTATEFKTNKIDETYYRESLYRMERRYTMLCCRSKNYCFAQENEWRLIWGKPSLRAVNFTTGKPYIIIKVSEGAILDSLQEIKISPQGNREIAQLFLEEVILEKYRQLGMNENDFFKDSNPRITRSSLPFRG